MASKHETTELLGQLVGGDRRVVQHLFSLLYEDLQQRARMAFGREQLNHTLQPTALVHEAFVRMVDQQRARWQDRAHFCAVASQVMRRILVDHAREKHAQRRGHGWRRIPLETVPTRISPARVDDVLLVDKLIMDLETDDPRQAEIVRLRFFGGLTLSEVAEVLHISRRTVEAEWTMLRAVIRSRTAAGH